MTNKERESLKRAKILFQQDLVNPKGAFIAPSYAQHEIDRIENILVHNP